MRMSRGMFCVLACMALTTSCGAEGPGELSAAQAAASPAADSRSQFASAVDETDAQTKTPCYRGSAFECEAEAEIARLTNAKRATMGLPRIVLNTHVSYTARAWSEAQAASGNLGHDGFPSLRERNYRAEFGSLEDLGYMSAENVAMFYPTEGVSALEVAARLVDMWWHSPGHRQNMLGTHSGLGAGISRAPNGAVYGTQLFFRGE